MKTVNTWYKGPTEVPHEVECLVPEEVEERREALQFYGYWQVATDGVETWWLPQNYVKCGEPLKVTITD